MIRIGLIGAGFIARVHAEALSALPNHQIAAVVDPNFAAAQKLAHDFGAPIVAGSVAEALAADGFDRAHILVPPDQHRPVAEQVLAAGKAVLLEKPLGASGAECQSILDTAAQHGVAVGVNQNFVYHPAFARLRDIVRSGKVGRPNFVSCIYNVPLRQLAARQFGHWMFRQPVNILLEQAVHPLSQLVALAGEVTGIKAQSEPAREISPDVPLVGSLCASLQCSNFPAQLRFAVGQNYPFWQITTVCDDGVVVADILANVVFTYGRTRWLEPLDRMLSGISTGTQLSRDAIFGFGQYAGPMLRLARKADPFFVSMRDSIAAFHAALSAGERPKLDGQFGASLVHVCESIADQVLPSVSPRAVGAAPARTDAEYNVAVLGGTGFIGTHFVRSCVSAGLRVSVLARSITNLDAIFANENVSLHRGSIQDAQAVKLAIGSAPVVVNLAHGGGGASWDEIRRAMVDGAMTVARVCQDLKVRRLIHVGSIASLYLGPQSGRVTGATPPDPDETQRADYARAKVLCDRALLELHARESFPVVILRPGLVVGEGSSPFHSGVGFYNVDQHCIGWNAGTNPLPFVLVEDVASALLLACSAPGIEGKCYNLVGDVRPTAREYIAALGHELSRPLKFHPQSPTWLWLLDVGKWIIKRVGGRAVPFPQKRDVFSRGLKAEFDCSDVTRDLGWEPVSDPAVFARRAVHVHSA